MKVLPNPIAHINEHLRYGFCSYCYLISYLYWKFYEYHRCNTHPAALRIWAHINHDNITTPAFCHIKTRTCGAPTYYLYCSSYQRPPNAVYYSTALSLWSCAIAMKLVHVYTVSHDACIPHWIWRKTLLLNGISFYSLLLLPLLLQLIAVYLFPALGGKTLLRISSSIVHLCG